MLSNLYLWHIKYSWTPAYVRRPWVVICFQICIFDILNTAVRRMPGWSFRCDLLSNLYLWHIKYSKKAISKMLHRVVICFQICIFDILNTAWHKIITSKQGCDLLSNLYLWHIKYSNKVLKKTIVWVVICFQICIFDILNTAIEYTIMVYDGCDLLSNLYLWHIKYSVELRRMNYIAVVICFQICIFDILNTA